MSATAERLQCARRCTPQVEMLCVEVMAGAYIGACVRAQEHARKVALCRGSSRSMAQEPPGCDCLVPHVRSPTAALTARARPGVQRGASCGAGGAAAAAGRRAAAAGGPPGAHAPAQARSPPHPPCRPARQRVCIGQCTLTLCQHDSERACADAASECIAQRQHAVLQGCMIGPATVSYRS